MPNTSYFFACSYPLGDGSVVKAGNWGRMLSKYSVNFGNPWILVRENIFERVRLEQFPAKPSRLKSIFLCESMESLKAFLTQANRMWDLAYEVELVEPTMCVHRGCLNDIDFKEGDTQDTFECRAGSYWRATSVVRPETVTESSIRILRKVAL